MTAATGENYWSPTLTCYQLLRLSVRHVPFHGYNIAIAYIRDIKQSVVYVCFSMLARVDIELNNGRQQ